MTKHYLTGEEIYQGYVALSKGLRMSDAAKKIGVSAQPLSDKMHELMHILNGGNMRIKKGKNQMKYALAKVRADLKRTAELQRPASIISSDVYQVLDRAITNLNNAVEAVIKYEVDRRAGKIQKELELYKEAAKTSNIATSLQDHFNGKLL
jgi:hypothetical protein